MLAKKKISYALGFKQGQYGNLLKIQTKMQQTLKERNDFTILILENLTQLVSFVIHFTACIQTWVWNRNCKIIASAWICNVAVAKILDWLLVRKKVYHRSIMYPKSMPLMWWCNTTHWHHAMSFWRQTMKYIVHRMQIFTCTCSRLMSKSNQISCPHSLV